MKMNENWDSFEILYPGNWIGGSNAINMKVNGKSLNFLGIHDIIWVLKGSIEYGTIEIHCYSTKEKTIKINEQVKNIDIKGRQFAIQSDNTPEGTIVKLNGIDMTNDILGFIVIIKSGELIKASFDFI